MQGVRAAQDQRRPDRSEESHRIEASWELGVLQLPALPPGAQLCQCVSLAHARSPQETNNQHPANNKQLPHRTKWQWMNDSSYLL